MTTQQFITLENGQKKVKTALVESTGANDAGKIPALNNEGKIDTSMLPDAQETADILTASETLSAGDFINLYNNANTTAVRLADNTNGRVAHGFVKKAAASGESVAVYALGVTNANLSALKIGERCYLGVVGKVIQTPLDESTAANKGYISQYLGLAKSDKEILTLQEDGIIL